MKYSKQSDHPVPIVGVIVLNDRDEILLTRRAQEPFFGSWVIPGGKVEVQDDCVEATAIREVKEETGLDIELTNLVGVYSSQDDPRFFVAEVIYAARIIGGVLQTNSEVSEFYLMKNEGNGSLTYGFNHRWLIQQFRESKKSAASLIPIKRSRFTAWYGTEYPYFISAYPRFACMAIVRNAEGEILLARRAQKPFVGCWDFPGGHMYVDETPEACLKREVREELGVECAVGDLFQVYSDKGQNPKNADIAAFYFVTLEDNHFVKNIEMDDFHFFSLREIPRDMAYQNQIVLEDLQQKKFL